MSRIFARKLGISPVTAQLLINRGIYTVEQGRAFLGSELARLYPPQLLKDMEKAVARILRAAENGEKILVYGDYDVDGITATVLLVRVLRRLGAKVHYYIPNRLEEGYGLHLAVLQKAREGGTELVVTVDCGISALAEAAWAQANGLDLIVTDHHEPPPEIPGALAVINPKRPDCGYPFKELAGVGVALKLAQALLEAAGDKNGSWQDYLDLVCLGTIADIVPVHGENRILVKHGLPRLAATANPGLKALIAASGIKEESLGAREVGFGLAPRLNAAGRIGSPELAARLLLTDNSGEAWELAAELNRGNQARQKIESAVMEEALKLLEEEPEQAGARVMVLASENWHPGVIGIVASRLMERFYRPVLLIALEGRAGKGSARSIPEFNIYKALGHCREYLLDYGGHALAAGFSIEKDRVGDFSREINRYAEALMGDRKILPRLVLDGIIDIDQVSEELVQEINLLQPFGHHNPDPMLGCLRAPVLESRGVGRGAAHLKLRLRGEKSVLDGIGFHLGAYAEVLATAETVDLAFIPGINEYNGRRSVQLEVKDIGIPAPLDIRDQQNRGISLAPAGPRALSGGEPAEDREELFIPEFVLETLGNLKMIEWPWPGLNQKHGGRVEVIDRRGFPERPGLLAELACGGEPTLVVTSCGYQTIELAHYLQLARPALKGRAAFCHGFTPEKELSALAVKFAAGEIEIVVATPAAAGMIGRHASQAIIYHLPCSSETVKKVMSAMDPGGRLCLLFSPGDLEENLAGLAALAPDREYLACLYKMLRKEQNNKGEVILNPARAARAMAEAGFLHGRAFTVEVALTVLEELGLIVVGKGRGDFLKVALLPVPPAKKDLLAAQTYKRLHQLKEDSITWMRKILNEPLHSLWNF
ncbi:MAG: single-stranded-DNA-specific exonuclease RecJ [Peptococcaceae bacterium]|nr:single-stranded-DNA-specific exonuclease RecJ [Peptococcaceae bacterium]